MKFKVHVSYFIKPFQQKLKRDILTSKLKLAKQHAIVIKLAVV